MDFMVCLPWPSLPQLPPWVFINTVIAQPTSVLRTPCIIHGVAVHERGTIGVSGSSLFPKRWRAPSIPLAGCVDNRMYVHMCTAVEQI